MLYKENLEKSMDNYNKLKEQYEKLVYSDKFYQVSASMPFDFLKGRYIIETLALYKDMDGQARLNFRSGDDAVQRFLDITDFKNHIEDILDGAAFVMEVAEVEKQINTLVSSTPYLSSSLEVPTLGRLENIANDCVKELPMYKSLMTKEFRIGYIESCIQSLPKNELSKLLTARIIKDTDLDKISLTGGKQYEENIKFLCEITGHKEIIEKNFVQRLKGVKANDDNGISRQDYLKEISKMIREGKTPDINVVPCIYTPEMGNPEPSIKIMWDDKCIGFMPKEVAKNLSEAYENPQYKASIKNIIGGNDIAYGCEINFSVISPKYTLSNEKENIQER